jgi:predicted dehydrogenase
MSEKKRDTVSGITRREFMRASVTAGALAAVSPVTRILAGPPAKKRYVIVGVGSRSRFYQRAIQNTYADHCELVGFCDVNPGRLKLAQKRSMAYTGKNLPVFMADDFDRMISETRPDTVIVTTVDGFHHRYIVRGMELGCDILTEKPMTTDAEKCQRIVDTQKKTGKRCRVGFNYRYSPPRTQVKDLLMSGVIGDLLSVDFHWLLNTHHGADYFRRWHSQKKFSGGLMVHKATHHFDLVNWWLSAVPVSVYATGKREFYTPAMAKRFGLDSHHERCHTCPEKARCGFELDLAADRGLRELYLDNEHYDGYFRDRCVFRPDIDIEDTMNVLVIYSNNVTLCYSLNAFNSWEGYHIMFNGTRGRIEHTIKEKIYISGTATEQGGIKSGGITTRVIPLRGPVREIEPWAGEGGHGGGDQVLLDDLFKPGERKDKYMRVADQRAGAYSILTGVAANHAFRENRPIHIQDLVKGIGMPEFTDMPSRTASLPMPEKRDD